MAMLRPESEMKDSGIWWMGSIPKNWTVPKLLYVLRNKISDGPHETPNYIDAGIPFISIDSLNDSKDIDFSVCKRFISEDEYRRFSSKTVLEQGDILFSKAATIGKTAIVGNEKFMVWSPLAIIKNAPEKIHNQYLYYLLNCSELITAIALSGSMNTQINVGMRELEQARIPLPSAEEQKAIASYLDDRCSKLDEIITEAEKSIEEYVLYKQAIIAEATTKGINKQVSMRTSPFEWMGDIPSHWELKPFRYILNERNEKNNPVKSRERLSLSIDKGVTLYAEKTTNLDRFKEDFSAYKLAHEGDLVMNCMNMIVGASGVSKYYGCVSPVYYTYYDNESDHITSKYYEYLFRSRMLMRVLHSLGRGILSFDRGEDRVNTCRLKISRNDLRSLILPVPPVEEQREIVEYLTNYDEQINTLISEKQSLIEDLKAYKKSLIYEAVTGKRRIL